MTRRGGARKIWKVQDLAMKMGAPIIGINDSGGAARFSEIVEFCSQFFTGHRNMAEPSIEFRTCEKSA